MFDLDDKRKMLQICLEHEAFQRWGHKWLGILVTQYPFDEWHYTRMVKELEMILLGKPVE